MSSLTYTILVAEDDDSIRHALTDVLTASGYEVLAAEEGLAAIRAVRERNFDLALLDVAMPGADGFQVLQVMSEERPGTPVIMLTARGEEEDRVQGLKLGADDYIVKPFSPREVVSRIKAVLRRTCAAPDTAQEEKLTTLTFGSLEIQPERYSVKLAGQSIACTPREVELLYLLASHPGRVFDREQILSRIWGYDFFGDTRTVDTHIKRLRQKLSCDEMGQKWDIITVYGVGYKFEAEA